MCEIIYPLLPLYIHWFFKTIWWNTNFDDCDVCIIVEDFWIDGASLILSWVRDINKVVFLDVGVVIIYIYIIINLGNIVILPIIYWWNIM